MPLRSHWHCMPMKKIPLMLTGAHEGAVITVPKRKQEKASNMTKIEFSSQIYPFIIIGLHTEKNHLQDIFMYYHQRIYHSQLLPLAVFPLKSL